MLTQSEWTELPGPGVRMKFRRDGTGFYEREGGPKFVRDTLLYKVEGETLKLKFAHVREWTDVGMQTRDGTPSSDGRYGKRVLVLTHDPYIFAIDGVTTGPLTLQSDSGAALLG